ncbi:MAG: FHA domain-containing protein [Candidatus Galacturonibacter soehngenii]|nr:FHA domain-containing protein [Candidatus Galacturonibacter soehngenii]
MQLEFKRDLNNNYMILSDDSLSNSDDYRVRMLISNKIPFILKCNVRKFDQATKYYYEITSKHPISRIFEKKKIKKEELNILVTSFLKVLESSFEYLLNPNDFILEPEYIYMNIETNQIYFCYMPGFEKDISQSFHTLTAYILERIDHEDKYTVATAYELYRQTMNDNYSLRNILSSITIEENKVEYSKSKEVEQEIPTVSQASEEIEKSTEKIKSKKPLFLFGGLVIISALALLLYFLYQNLAVIKSIEINNDILLKVGGVLLIVIVIVIYSFYKKAQSKLEEESDSLIIVEDDESIQTKLEKDKEESIEPVTLIHKEEVHNESIKEDLESSYYGNTVLLNYRVPNKRLISTMDIYQNFDLKEKTFLIGKMQEHVDGVVLDERISRIHAEIKKVDSKYFLTDLNSTNGTFHNGRRLEANETVEIHPEDRIQFATVEYVFR